MTTNQPHDSKTPPTSSSPIYTKKAQQGDNADLSQEFYLHLLGGQPPCKTGALCNGCGQCGRWTNPHEQYISIFSLDIHDIS